MDKSVLQKLRSLPTQVIELDKAVILKRGCTESKISGEGASNVVRFVLALTADGGASREEICQKVPTSQHAIMHQLIDYLIDKHLLIPDQCNALSNQRIESQQDIFYWHFKESLSTVAQRLNTFPLAILGVNYISLQIGCSLMRSGWNNFYIIDVPQLRNLRLFDDNTCALKPDEWISSLSRPKEYEEWLKTFDPKMTDCIIVTSDFGNCSAVSEWNQFSIEHQKKFLPIILHNLIGHIGPLVIPGETACYECMRMRQHSHAERSDAQQALENLAFEGQVVVGFHPSMASILGDIASFELIKFYSGILPRRNSGSLIEVNLLVTAIRTRRVLKLPRCAVCSPLHQLPSTAINKSSSTSVDNSH